MPVSDQETDVEQLLESVNDSSRGMRATYLTFLLAALYFAILIGSTTDEQLLRESGITLPLLNVQLPIVGFYVIGPWLLVLLHFNLLQGFSLLAEKTHAFNDAITTYSVKDLSGRADPKRLNHFRDLLHAFPFTQVRVGRKDGTWARVLLPVMMWVSVVFTPVVLLVWAQVRFLPYHNEVITFTHQLAVLGDLVLLRALWPSRRPASSEDMRPVFRKEVRRRYTLRTLASVTLLFSFTDAVVPGGVIERHFSWPRLTDWVGAAVLGKTGIRNLNLREKTLVAEEPPPEVVAEYLRQEKTVEEAWVDHARGLDLRDRDLRNADLFATRFFAANLARADLRGADLSNGQFQGADLRKGRLDGADLSIVQLPGANLIGANLAGADLMDAQLQGAGLQGAVLLGADLSGAKLQGADLFNAELRGAYLYRAKLKGADLVWAQIGGADFRAADLSIADMRNVGTRPLPAGKWEQLEIGMVSVLPPGTLRNEVLERLKSAAERTGRFDKAAVNGRLLSVEENEDLKEQDGFSDLSVMAFSEARAPFLVSLACTGTPMARGVARSIWAGDLKPEFVIGRDVVTARALLQTDCQPLKELVPDLRNALEEAVSRIPSSTPDQ